MIVCYPQLEYYIIVSTVFFDFVILKFFSTVYSQISNLSASEGDKVWKDTKYSLPLSTTNRKYRLRSGRQPRLQASPQSMRKSVPGGEKSGVVLVPLRTHKMVADALTKSLQSPAFVGHHQIMTGHASFAARLLRCVGG